MSGAYWAPPLSDTDLDFRLSRLVEMLDDWGPPRYAYEPDGKGRQFRAEVKVSTYDATGVRLIYAESWEPTDRGWVLVEYKYNYIDQARGRYFGHHFHPLRSIQQPDSITHDHCVPPFASDDHLRGTWVELNETHHEFLRWAADADLYPDCRGRKVLTRSG